MSEPHNKRHLIGIDQVCIGLHIRLESWLGHPFLFSSFKVKDEEQIVALKSMGLKEIEYLPHKSDVRPKPPVAPTAGSEPPKAVFDQLMQEKREHIETLSKERQRIQAAEKKYAKTAAAVKNVMRLANHNPAQAAEQSREISEELIGIFLSDDAPFIHLMGDNVIDENAYFHGLNVTMLSLILGRATGIGDPQVMHDIAQGAILHDVGKSMIPSQVLMKTDEFTAAENKLVRLHPSYGIKLMQPVEGLSRRVREIILFHHEMIDGSGYPKGLSGDAIEQAVRIVTVANAYDNHCNARITERSRTPSEALSLMFKNENAKYDKAILSAFIKSLGIYPPGTIVQLKSGRVGIVMSVDSADLLHPDIMIYDASIPKQDAAVVNLRRDLDDQVDRTLRPGALPAAVHDYLSPRKRVCYFVDSAAPG